MHGVDFGAEMPIVLDGVAAPFPRRDRDEFVGVTTWYQHHLPKANLFHRPYSPHFVQQGTPRPSEGIHRRITKYSVRIQSYHSLSLLERDSAAVVDCVSPLRPRKPALGFPLYVAVAAEMATEEDEIQVAEGLDEEIGGPVAACEKLKCGIFKAADGLVLLH